MGKLTNVQPAISIPSKKSQIYPWLFWFVMKLIISKVLTYIFIFEIGYSGFLLSILISGTFLGLPFYNCYSLLD
tara:strand:+ start:529 stop:750 length:222 start_codon:yes stop_codon:yes gene_type:complete